MNPIMPQRKSISKAFSTSLLALTLLSQAAAATNPDPKTEVQQLTISSIQEREISNTIKRKNFHEPIVIKSYQQVEKAIKSEQAKKILKEVDFKHRTILIFSWSGSSSDRILHEIKVKAPKGRTVYFRMNTGPKKADHRPHIKIYSLDKRRLNAFKVGRKYVILKPKPKPYRKFTCTPPIRPHERHTG